MTKTVAFVENFKKFSDFFESIRRGLPKVEYRYMEEQEFVKLLVAEPAAANRVYVQELLFRTHFAALTTLFRNRRWMAGMDAALKYPNYFSFCACLRGFVESAADSHDALLAGMSTVGENFGAFAYALSGQFSKAAVCCESLEEILIHYSHARRIGKGHNAPPSHRSKTSQEYLTAFENTGSRAIRDLYAELCDITHPTAMTVLFFGQADAGALNVVRLVDPDDRKFIEVLLHQHDSAFHLLFQKSFNAALLTLHVLNRFDDIRFFTPLADEITSAYTWAIGEIEAKIADAIERFQGE